MRLMLTSLLALTLLACGSANAPAPVGNAPAANKPGVTLPDKPAETPTQTDPWDAIPEPQIETSMKWLFVSATLGEDFTWIMNGTETDLDGLKQQLNTYAATASPAGKLKGRNADGISSNPVVFTAGPESSSKPMFALIELMASASMYRFMVELNVPGHKPRRIWQQLPVDEGLSDGGPVPEEEDGLPDAREFVRALPNWQFSVYVGRDGRDYSYETYIQKKDRTMHEDTVFNLDDLLKDGWNEPLYRRIRRALAEAMLTRQGEGDDALDEVEITPMATASTEEAYAHWAPVFLAMDAADLANNAPNRGERPQLFTKFRFLDALGQFK